MASLVEYQDLNPKYPAAAPTAALSDPECCDVQALDEIMRFEPLPTPPLSPEHITANPPHKESFDANPMSIDDHAEALLNEMLQCEQIVPFEEDNFSVNNSQNCFSSNSVMDIMPNIGADLLIQDCMWNSDAYEPRNLFGNVNGIYTPAPSPPPPTAKNGQDEQSLKDDIAEERIVKVMESSNVQQECISPCDIFPAYLLVTGPLGEKLTIDMKGSENPKEHHQKISSGGSNKSVNSRIHSQATSSESGKPGNV